jgi:hypothetical protein
MLVVPHVITPFAGIIETDGVEAFEETTAESIAVHNDTWSVTVT